MTKLWQKDENILHPKIEEYTVGSDYIFDREIMSYDILASLAHAKGLEKIGILTKDEFNSLKFGLQELENEWQAGKINITIQDEDCHTVIENYLTNKLGSVGKKIHTGRSRNDQVLTAMRLYMKAELNIIKQLTLDLVKTFLAQTKKHKNVPLPGYSHTQQAMLSSVGHYYASFVESLLDDLEFLQSVKSYIDKSPLGSAAGFGVNLDLPRKFVAEELGFANVQTNSMYCQNSKGKFESAYLESLSQIMMTLSKFATDMLMFSSQEFKFFVINPNLVTGSSIMPHKKNLDVLEIIRGNATVVQANQMMVKELYKNLLSGYNRDSQLMKKPLFGSIKIVKASLEVAKLFLEGITPDKKEIESKINPNIFMADLANQLVVEQGICFRDAYILAKDKISEYNIIISDEIHKKISLGAAGNLCLEEYEERIKLLS